MREERDVLRKLEAHEVELEDEVGELQRLVSARGDPMRK